MKDQNGDLQNQTIALQNQTRQLQDRVKQLLEQLDELYNSPVQIISYEWIGGFNPIGSLTLAYPVNVTLQNKGDVDSFLPGETREIKAWTYASLNEKLDDAAIVITLKSGNTILDEWTRSIG